MIIWRKTWQLYLLDFLTNAVCIIDVKVDQTMKKFRKTLMKLVLFKSMQSHTYRCQSERMPLQIWYGWTVQEDVLMWKKMQIIDKHNNENNYIRKDIQPRKNIWNSLRKKQNTMKHIWNDCLIRG